MFAATVCNEKRLASDGLYVAILDLLPLRHAFQAGCGIERMFYCFFSIRNVCPDGSRIHVQAVFLRVVKLHVSFYTSCAITWTLKFSSGLSIHLLKYTYVMRALLMEFGLNFTWNIIDITWYLRDASGLFRSTYPYG